MTIVTTYLLGETDTAIAMAEDLLAGVPEGDEEGRARGSNRLNRFLEDPEEFVSRAAAGVQELELRLLEIEGQLMDNGGR